MQDASIPRLMLEANFLTCFPPILTALTALEVLCLGRNIISTVDAAPLRAMTRLRSLSLDGNRIAQLPVTISCMTALQVYPKP